MLGGSAGPIALAPNHCGKRSWSTMITRMLGCAGGTRATVAVARRFGLLRLIAVGLGERLDAEAGAGEHAAGDRAALEERPAINSHILLRVHAVDACSRPGAVAGPWSGGCRPDRHRRSAVSAYVRPHEHRQLCSAGRRHNSIAPAGQSRRIASDADQLPRRVRQRSDDPERRRIAQRHAFRAAGRLLPGRRCELPAGSSLRRRRARDRAGARPRPSEWQTVLDVFAIAAAGPDQLHPRDDPPGRRRRRTALPLASRPAPAGGDGDRQLARRRPKATSSSPPTPAPGQAGPMILDPSGAAAVVQAAGARHLRHQPARAGIRRQARAHLVAGGHLDPRLRSRRRHPLLELLHRSRTDSRRQRTPPRPARLRPRRGWHSARDLLLPDALQPVGLRRTVVCRADGRGDAGDRRPHRARDVRMDEPRPRRGRGIVFLAAHLDYELAV